MSIPAMVPLRVVAWSGMDCVGTPASTTTLDVATQPHSGCFPISGTSSAQGGYCEGRDLGHGVWRFHQSLFYSSTDCTGPGPTLLDVLPGTCFNHPATSSSTKYYCNDTPSPPSSPTTGVDCSAMPGDCAGCCPYKHQTENVPNHCMSILSPADTCAPYMGPCCDDGGGGGDSQADSNGGVTGVALGSIIAGVGVVGTTLLGSLLGGTAGN